jgi:heparan-alpha-glucosaminide N-acetyltransferase
MESAVRNGGFGNRSTVEIRIAGRCLESDRQMNSSLETWTNEVGGEPERARAPAPRVVSIDIFRGLTMAVMIFVNALSDIHGLPWWTYHAHAKDDVMTYVDMVFPFFLFAVGLSLPLSVTQRLERKPSMVSLWAHVAIRALALVVLGEILANAEKADAARMGMQGSLWALLALICACLYLNVYGKSVRGQRYGQILRVIGFAGVVVLLALFRRSTSNGQTAWLDGSYPEILGLIGYSYLAVAILYIPTRRWAWAPAAWFALLLALCALSTAGWLVFPGRFPLYVWPFGNGAMCCIIMAGTVTSSIYLSAAVRGTPRPIYLAISFGLLAFAAGWMLTPLGISKIRATPTWSLYSIGAAVLLFTLLYWICDVKQRQRWAFLIRPAGSNTLLTYLLPDFWYFALSVAGFTWLDAHFNAGAAGVLKTLAFTLGMLAVAGVLTRAKLRLQL